MRITFIDDSHPFDADTPANRPLGGTEKSIIGLATTLAARDHDVAVINRGTEIGEKGGVTWVPWDAPRPVDTDILIASRKAKLLGEIDKASRRILWVSAHARYLNKPVNQELLERFEPTLLFQGNAHFDTWKPWRKFTTAVIEAGVAEAFRGGAEDDAARRQRVLVTTHPLHGLMGVLDLWKTEIRPAVPSATLHVYSAALFKGENGGEISEKLKPVFEAVMAARDQGVAIKRPGSDGEMARTYREARVHMYPQVNGEMYCSTLAESQAAGLPAVAVETPAAKQRVRNGQTGFLVPDAAALANVTIHLLKEEGAMMGMARDASLLQSGRGWAQAAPEFEALFG